MISDSDALLNYPFKTFGTNEYANPFEQIYTSIENLLLVSDRHIRAYWDDEEDGNVSTFVIPYVFNSPRGSLSFMFQASIQTSATPILQDGLLKVSLCLNDGLPENVDLTASYIFEVAELTYSCLTAENVEVIV